MFISVAICTYERYAELDTCLAALRRQSLPADRYEILVMDNSPDRETSDLMQRRLGAGTRWQHLQTPGLAHARNAAIASARSPLLAFIDDDVSVSPGWLAALLDGFTRFGEAAHSAGGPVRPEWQAPPPAWLAEGMLPFLSLIDRGAEARLLEPQEWIPGANAAYRRARLEAAGGFREQLGRQGGGAILLSNEETELVDRLHRQGGGTAWLPAAVVRHRIDAGRLDRDWFRRRFAWQAVSDFLTQPGHQRQLAAANWREAAGYLAHRGATGLDALGDDHDDPLLCHWQMSAIYRLMLGLLGGGAHG